MSDVGPGRPYQRTPGSRVLLPPSPHAPAIARQHLRSVTAALPPEHLDAALLATSELVTNAIVHGRPDITLAIALDAGALTVYVADSHPQLPPTDPKPVAPGHPNGRGLIIVNALATRWGIAPHEQQTGKSVWFQLDLT